MSLAHYYHSLSIKSTPGGAHCLTHRNCPDSNCSRTSTLGLAHSVSGPYHCLQTPSIMAASATLLQLWPFSKCLPAAQRHPASHVPSPLPNLRAHSLLRSNGSLSSTTVNNGKLDWGDSSLTKMLDTQRLGPGFDP